MVEEEETKIEPVFGGRKAEVGRAVRVAPARTMRHAVIRSQDLYVVYLLASRDDLDREEFWRGLFEAEGPFDMARYGAKLDEEEAEQLGAYEGRTK